ncbi:phosphoribosylglycinamide formyltransferase 2 [Striga asiatica]|uniref:Phosphoribosylglycinamide formyltransferase 2 n=1 Tax=Striga asiatica TaxID=4170 RepID=A0A5A7QRQ9_STRAF|nr:phosphoribosylglycinamide formyltransferase 2 [Striga asiatica]
MELEALEKKRDELGFPFAFLPLCGNVRFWDLDGTSGQERPRFTPLCCFRATISNMAISNILRLSQSDESTLQISKFRNLNPYLSKCSGGRQLSISWKDFAVAEKMW